MNDDDVRALLAAAVERNSGLGGNGTELRLARIGRELMRQRDARSEDFLRVARELTALKARYAALEERLAKTRAEVAEEIAQAIEGETGLNDDLRYAARIAREHGKEK